MARYKFNFWLDAAKDDELLVAEKVDELKRKRSFSSVLRDGIMIVSELREGRIDLLLRLYPWIADAIRPPTPAAPNTGDLERQLADLKRIILEQGSVPAPPADYPAMKPAAATLGQGRVISAPTFDDDDTLITVSKATPVNNGAALMAKIMTL